MTDRGDKLTPATPDDLAQSISFALRFNGRKQFRQASEVMAEFTAQHVAEHLLRSFVIMRAPPEVRTTDQYPRPKDREDWS